MPVTFDLKPETEAVLRSYAARRGVAFSEVLDRIATEIGKDAPPRRFKFTLIPLIRSFKSLFKQYPCTLQILPATGWAAVYAGEDGTAIFAPLMGWMLQEEESGERHITWFGNSLTDEERQVLSPNLLGYALAPFKPEEWEERIKTFKGEAAVDLKEAPNP